MVAPAEVNPVEQASADVRVALSVRQKIVIFRRRGPSRLWDHGVHQGLVLLGPFLGQWHLQALFHGACRYVQLFALQTLHKRA
jgi:hypothetical protein